MQLHLDDFSRHLAAGAHAAPLLDRAGTQPKACKGLCNLPGRRVVRRIVAQQRDAESLRFGCERQSKSSLPVCAAWCDGRVATVATWIGRPSTRWDVTLDCP